MVLKRLHIMQDKDNYTTVLHQEWIPGTRSTVRRFFKNGTAESTSSLNKFDHAQYLKILYTYVLVKYRT